MNVGIRLYVLKIKGNHKSDIMNYISNNEIPHFNPLTSKSYIAYFPEWIL